MSDKITNLEIELDKADNDIKELEELLRNKKRIANLLEGIHHLNHWFRNITIIFTSAYEYY